MPQARRQGAHEENPSNRRSSSGRFWSTKGRGASTHAAHGHDRHRCGDGGDRTGPGREGNRWRCQQPADPGKRVGTRGERDLPHLLHHPTGEGAWPAGHTSGQPSDEVDLACRRGEPVQRVRHQSLRGDHRCRRSDDRCVHPHGRTRHPDHLASRLERRPRVRSGHRCLGQHLCVLVLQPARRGLLLVGHPALVGCPQQRKPGQSVLRRHRGRLASRRQPRPGQGCRDVQGSRSRNRFPHRRHGALLRTGLHPDHRAGRWHRSLLR